MKPKAIDLFAGPGGLSLGLKEAGFDIIAAVEMDPDAGATYRHNIGNHTEIQDITKFSAKKLRKKLEQNGNLKEGENLTLIAGGPPCPGFSLIGRSKIMDLIKKGQYGDSKDARHAFIDDPRNHLFLEFVKYVKEFKPDYFIMENVSGMRSYQIEGDPIVEVIKRKFTGYSVEERILSSADYGVPQDRKRIIFMGFKKKGVTSCEFPVTTHDDCHLTSLDAIKDLLEVNPTNDGIVYTKDTDHSSQGAKFRKKIRNWKCVRQNGTEVSSKRGKKTSHWTRSVNDRDKVLFQFLKSGASSNTKGKLKIKSSTPRQIYGDIYPELWESNLVPAFNKAGLTTKEIDNRHHVVNKQGKSWIMYPVKGFKDKMRRIRWDKPSPTVVAHLAKDGYMFIHPTEDRTITVREAARFQSFPDSFEFLGSMSSQFRQVGNAVPPLLGEALGKAIIKIIKSSSQDS
ncbi:DNA cytosine methyltransferase [Candidatus Poseidoniales archaeon]|nr:DNA cytosine methyltransferase [Candidatus Poseidoniales archaeon]